VIISLWLEKGLGLMVGGFVPAPLGAIAQYTPTLPEWSIVLGVWAIGALLITVFYKITLSVREQVSNKPTDAPTRVPTRVLPGAEKCSR
jgi:molybdopterin-containing oxidoreductase family membrane subunit